MLREREKSKQPGKNDRWSKKRNGFLEFLKSYIAAFSNLISSDETVIMVGFIHQIWGRRQIIHLPNIQSFFFLSVGYRKLKNNSNEKQVSLVKNNKKIRKGWTIWLEKKLADELWREKWQMKSVCLEEEKWVKRRMRKENKWVFRVSHWLTS